MLVKRGQTVISRCGQMQCKTTGGTRPCRLEGCLGVRVGVRWPDGTLTWPCTKGMAPSAGRWKIL